MTASPSPSSASAQARLAERFLALHVPGSPLLLPNPWDVGSARLFASLGFAALATTSSGMAAARGTVDGRVPRDEVLAHCRAIADATPLPLSADLADCFADSPDGVAQTARLAAGTGLAGFSIEDSTGDAADPIHERGLAQDRVRAVVEAAHAGPARLVVTARAENFLHGRPDLADTIARLQAYQEAGADVLYAPGLTDPGHIRAVVDAVDRPVNVLGRPGTPPVADLARLGVARISVGGAFAFLAYGAAREAAEELLHQGGFGYTARSGPGKAAMDAAAGWRG